MKILQFSFILLLLTYVCACNKAEFEPYDHPFVHIMKDEISKEKVSAKANYTAEYFVYLSSRPLSEALIVDFKISTGNGLTEGLDYEMVTKGATLKFLPGIYQMPIRIHWLPNKVDVENVNELTIELTGNNLGLTMGLPGNDHHQSSFVIEKVN